MRTWRRWRRSVFFRRRPSSRRSGRLRPWVGGVIGMVLALALIGHLELQLRPVLEAMAVAKVKNVVAQTLDAAVAAEISARGVTYGDLITIERDGSGSITALTSDMTAMNELRTGILTAVLTAVEELDPDRLSIPVGNLTGVSFFSGKGFSLPVEITAAGSAHGVFQSQFTGAGINQTRHQLSLEVTAELEILLPGGVVEMEVSAQVPVAETVIVGQVPDTYLGLSSGLGTQQT